MKKIGIITTYDEINFGAYLQAYSLFTFIQNLGFDVELINYKSNQYRLAEFKSTFNTKNPIYFCKLLLKYFKFKAALNKLKVSKRLNSDLEIDLQGYDLIVYGSDEIWNLDNCLGGIVDLYYFGGNTKTKKISYAASFGSTSLNSLKLDSVKSILSEFNSITVRDDNSALIIKTIKLDCNIVLDPTFLIHPPIKTSSVQLDKYIFYYCVSADEMLDSEVASYATKNNLEIVSFGYKHKKFKNIIGIDPFEWLNYLANAHVVITNMYHGTIFSLIHSKKLAVHMTDYRINKLGSLLKLLNAEYCIYTKGNLENILENPIVFTKFNEKIDSLRNESIRNLIDAIK